MVTKIFLTDTADFDNDFYVAKSAEILKYKKVDNYRGLEFQKESILAWSVFVKYCDDNGITPFIKYNSNGKPYCDNLNFNISHSHGLVAVAFSECNIGIDIEKINYERDRSRLYNRVLSEKEIAQLKQSYCEPACFYKLWTLKESLLKNTGQGLSGGLSNWDFSAFLYEDEFQIFDKSFFSLKVRDVYFALCTDEKTDNFFVDIDFSMLTNV